MSWILIIALVVPSDVPFGHIVKIPTITSVEFASEEGCKSAMVSLRKQWTTIPADELNMSCVPKGRKDD